MSSPVEPQPKVEAKPQSSRRPARRPKRRTFRVETTEYLQAAERFIRAAGRRVADGDEIELANLLRLEDVLKEAIQSAVDGQRALGKSWPAIAAATGKSQQAAAKRWGRTNSIPSTNS